jgi:hypothetical protein
VIRVGWPQLECGLPSSPILPPVGSPGQATRFSDVLTLNLTKVGLANMAGSFVLTGTMESLPSGNASRSVLRFDDSTGDNLVSMNVNSSGRMSDRCIEAGVRPSLRSAPSPPASSSPAGSAGPLA